MTLSVSDLSIHHQSTRLFPPVSFSVGGGDVYTLMGPSGCGKSTLLAAIAGHLAPEFTMSGNILLHDRPVVSLPPNERKIGLLFQDDLLFPHLNILENLMFGLPKKYKGEKRREQAMQTLASIDLQSLADHMPEQISGGQRARVSLMRMLLSEPQAVLLDEPFNKLDKALRTEFRQLVFEQIRAKNIPAIMVTHDRDDAPEDGVVLCWPWDAKETGDRSVTEPLTDINPHKESEC
ncbi:ATP-binding cassette domain-containing protein [Vibrio salinus]|uniref:ATP-binding cassette domain-containing protein n=1 Tax=Vibrio salinus TaxID=2899784 RepID=UPI001E43896E|nr:ATP-binding cassette domain-containing protein [Vibrio salinus]MCE0494779.1 ATP-binding cassette domain-containing protein [Vibrio salinus]